MYKNELENKLAKKTKTVASRRSYAIDDITDFKLRNL